MDLNIAGKVALVGASAGGLGLATATRLAMEGCHVASSDGDASRLDHALATGKGLRQWDLRHIFKYHRNGR
jgi:NAD(P)-dependent dehydrogenase (short-subunit alcohol dehydrogenase family)